jgi:uncharacterized membrane protein YgcG
MKRLSTLCALICAAISIPAFAATYFQDGANMLSASTVSTLDQRIGNFNAQTGKEIVVVTVPSLNGTSLADAAHQAFTQRNVNGVLVFIAKDDRRDIIVPDAAGASAGWFTRDTLDTIRQTMESQFKAEDYDGGVTSAVNGILNIYRAHLSTNVRRENYNPASVRVPASAASNGGFRISMFWWIVIIVVGFLIIRSIIRAASGPRYGPPGVPPGAVPPGGMPPAGYGQGYGGGFGGGGGSFWSGLLGGLGGAWLGNEMFGNRGGGNALGTDAGAGTASTGDAGSWGGASGDAGGLASDAGQADMGGASGGDWSGGGFGGGDSGGGGGDFGGGGGGDSGGGW